MCMKCIQLYINITKWMLCKYVLVRCKVVCVAYDSQVYMYAACVLRGAALMLRASCVRPACVHVCCVNIYVVY